MTVSLHPETEKLVAEEIRSGHFHSLDELIVEGVRAWREKHQSPALREPRKKSFAQFLMESPLPSSGLALEREKSLPRPIEL